MDSINFLYYLNNTMMLLILSLSIVCVIFFFIIKNYFFKLFKFKFTFDKVVLLISVPKNSGNKEDSKKSIKEMLGSVERFWSNIGGLKAQTGLKNKIFGRSDSFSFEIVADKEGIISFYAVVPQHLQRFFEQQLQAQYPLARIDIVDDYNIFLTHGTTMSAFLSLKNNSMLPIRTYLKLETDFLNSIINSLTKIADEDAAVIQIVTHSAMPYWRDRGTKVASKMQQGNSFSEALKITGTKAITKIFIFLCQSLVPKKQNDNHNPTPQKDHQLSPMEQEIVKSLEEKASKAGFETNIRIIVSSQNKEKAQIYLNNITNAFAQYTDYQYGNGFNVNKGNDSTVENFIYRFFDKKNSFVLNAEEMTSIYHLPLSTNETPNIRWLGAKGAPAPINISSQGLFMGYNTYRGEKTEIRIKRKDRRRHMYVIGMTGTGKSWFAEGLAMQDIANGEGACFIDPHGDAIEHILERIPKNRAEDVILFDPADLTRPLGLNMLEYDSPEQKTFVINEVMNIFDKLYNLKQTGGPMFEQYFKNACHLIMDDPASGSTLLEVPKVLADENFRKYKLSKCKTQVVKEFWEKQALKAGGEASLQNIVPYITSKLTPFLTNEFMRPIISQQKSSLNFREAMDGQKIILAKLSKGKIGETNAYLLGMIIIGKILMSALARGDMPEDKRKDFYLYIDEFQNFLTDSMQIILSEARKYRLCLTMIHQYIGQLIKSGDTKFKDSIFGNVGTKVAYRVGVDDAETLTKEYSPVFNEYDFLNMPKYNAFVKLLIDNANPSPFNMLSIPFDDISGIQPANPQSSKIIKELSRLKYGKDKNMIENEIIKRSKLLVN